MNLQNEPRPLQWVRDIEKKYPEAWKHASRFRQAKLEGEIDWPDFVFIPVGAAVAIVQAEGPVDAASGRGPDIGAVAALAAWRATKGIYSFDTSLFFSLLDTPISGPLPTEIFERLPEWCVYVDLTGPWSQRLPDPQSMFGFFAHMEWDMVSHETELRLLLDTRRGLIPVPIPLTNHTLEDSIEIVWKKTTKSDPIHESPITVARIIGPLIAITLYLCSEQPDIASANPKVRRPGNPLPIKTRHGIKEFAASAPAVWNVGWRIGAAIRRTEAAVAEPAPRGEGSHASPRPHIRRAHWHTFRIGAGRQSQRLKWISPILVGAHEEDLPAVIRPVKK